MRIRIEDVAAAAGVSMKTVSRVLNNEPNVREQTRQRVMQAVDRLQYRPNASARSLAGQRSYVIALASLPSMLRRGLTIPLGDSMTALSRTEESPCHRIHPHCPRACSPSSPWPDALQAPVPLPTGRPVPLRSRNRHSPTGRTSIARSNPTRPLRRVFAGS